ncbi:hypothetical protein K501DRAFT_267252 [Backusella circina FSU 941]|nr:hypothetical protein K501DRAFT_267252 [Backusella circina FSU 941]
MNIPDIITIETLKKASPKDTPSKPRDNSKKNTASNKEENQAPSDNSVLKEWEYNMFSENGSFRNVNMKKLIQEMALKANPSAFEDMIKLLPNSQYARMKGPSFFDDSNKAFWRAVKCWENNLRSGIFLKCIDPVPVFSFQSITLSVSETSVDRVFDGVQLEVVCMFKQRTCTLYLKMKYFFIEIESVMNIMTTSNANISTTKND